MAICPIPQHQGWWWSLPSFGGMAEHYLPSFILPKQHFTSFQMPRAPQTAPLPMYSSLRKKSLSNTISSAAGGQPSHSPAWGICHQHLDSQHIRTQEQSHVAQQPRNACPELPAFQVVLALQSHEETRRGKRLLQRTDTTTQNHRKRTSLSAILPSNKSLLTALHDIISIQQHCT